MSCCNVQGLERLSKVVLRGCRKLTVSANRMEPHDAVEALRGAIPSLAAHQYPGIELALFYFLMSPELAAVMHELVAAGWTKLSTEEVGLAWGARTHTHTHSAKSHGQLCQQKRWVQTDTHTHTRARARTHTHACIETSHEVCTIGAC